MAGGTITEIKQKIRAIVEDWNKTDSETFIYSTSAVFTITDSNVSSISSVTKNGTTLATNKYSFSTSTNAVTVTESLVSGDVIVITYIYNKYSDTELIEFIRASLVLISVYASSDFDYELVTVSGSGGSLSYYIYSTPDNRTADFISLIASIIIKPDYITYRLPNITVTYPRKKQKEERIKEEVQDYFRGLGVWTIIDFDEEIEDIDV